MGLSEARAAERAGKLIGLLWRRVQPELVGTLNRVHGAYFDILFLMRQTMTAHRTASLSALSFLPMNGEV